MLNRFTCSAYLDEQSFRYNNRKWMDDADRFSAVVSQVTGKRLTYAELTGKVEQQQCESPVVEVGPIEPKWEPF